MKNEQEIWAIYYATMVGMSWHPGNRKNATDADAQGMLDYMSYMADEMMARHKRRYECQSSQD